MKEMERLKRKRGDRRRREEKEWFGRKDDADDVRALASRLEEQEKEMERLKKNREDRKRIEKKEWFGRTSRVSSNTRSEGEIVTEEVGSRFICSDILWINYGMGILTGTVPVNNSLLTGTVLISNYPGKSQQS